MVRLNRLVAAAVFTILALAVTGCGHPDSGLPAGSQRLKSYSEVQRPTATASSVEAATSSAPATHASKVSVGKRFCIYAADRGAAIQAFPDSPVAAQKARKLWSSLAARSPADIQDEVGYLESAVEQLATGRSAGLSTHRIAHSLKRVAHWAAANCAAG